MFRPPRALRHDLSVTESVNWGGTRVEYLHDQAATTDQTDTLLPLSPLPPPFKADSGCGSIVDSLVWQITNDTQ